MTEPSENTRRYPRFHIDVDASVHTADGRKLMARTRDLSRSGICLVTTGPLESREQLGIELVLLLGPSSTSEPLPLRARVVWCTAIAGAFQIGAMFDRLSTKEAAFLDMFLRYLDGSILPAGAEMETVDEGEQRRDGKDGVSSPDKKDDPFQSKRRSRQRTRQNGLRGAGAVDRSTNDAPSVTCALAHRIKPCKRRRLQTDGIADDTHRGTRPRFRGHQHGILV